MKAELPIDLWLYKHPCEKCREPFWNIMWMRISNLSSMAEEMLEAQVLAHGYSLEAASRVKMAVMIDQPTAVKVARMALFEMGMFEASIQLVDRTKKMEGASYNANQCPNCGHLADWYFFQHLIIEAGHDQHLMSVIGPFYVDLEDWVAITMEQHNLWGV